MNTKEMSLLDVGKELAEIFNGVNANKTDAGMRLYLAISKELLRALDRIKELEEQNSKLAEEIANLAEANMKKTYRFTSDSYIEKEPENKKNKKNKGH